MKKLLYIISILSLISCQYKRGEPDKSGHRMYKASETYYKKGDDASWAKKDFDFSNWQKERIETLGDEILWAKKTIEITKGKKTHQNIGVIVQVFGAYELFWDGVLIGDNGKPGLESMTEKLGGTLNTFLIPGTLVSKGSHSLTLRLSQYYTNDIKRGVYVFVGNYETLLREPLIDTLFINFLAGAFLIAAIYYFTIYINDRKKYSMLLFSLSSLLFFLLIVMEYIKFYIPIHYSNFYLRLKIIGTLTLFISFLVPYYFAIQFSFIKRKWFFIVYGILLIGVVIFFRGQYDLTAILLGQMMWLFSTIIICFAIYKKQKSAVIVLIGLILSFIVYRISVYDVSLFVSFGIILLCMFHVLSVKLKEQRLAFEFSIAESTRLKYELLKKKIQPHFLMNTLTSLIDWVEEAPEKGVKFIEALAEEFDLSNQVENEKLIPLSQEIKLCKSHLSIMKYRKEINYLWEDECVLNDETQTIPPAVIHTLLENGITHCLPNDNNEIRFKLIVESEAEKQKITFLTLAKVRHNKTEIDDGTGFKYVKARLTESYGDKWELMSQATKNGWKNEIIITA